MNCFLVVIDPTHLEKDPTQVETAFPSSHHKIFDGVWAVGSEKRTSADVCDLLGIKENERVGVVVKINDYYGVEDPALWNRLDAWQKA